MKNTRFWAVLLSVVLVFCTLSVGSVAAGKKFGDLESEAYIRQIFDDRTAAEQKLKNRLTELKRVHTEQFGEICTLFRAKFPGYAKITDEL